MRKVIGKMEREVSQDDAAEREFVIGVNDCYCCHRLSPLLSTLASYKLPLASPPRLEAPHYTAAYQPDATSAHSLLPIALRLSTHSRWDRSSSVLRARQTVPRPPLSASTCCSRRCGRVAPQPQPGDEGGSDRVLCWGKDSGPLGGDVSYQPDPLVDG